MGSPTSRSLEFLRKHDYTADVVEKTIPHSFIKKDLFGIWDILAINDDGKVVAVQATSYSNVNARIDKMAGKPQENETEEDGQKRVKALARCKKAGWTCLIWGWRKKNGRWTFREVVL